MHPRHPDDGAARATARDHGRQVAKRVPYVAVVGAQDADADELAVAEAVGRAVAEAGAVLVCGGLGGVMEAACRGAFGAGGVTLGILPGSDRGDANPFVTVAVATGMGEARNAVVVGTADAVVAVGGGYGTLSEIALALRAGTPVVGLGTWELRRRGHDVEAVLRAEDSATAVAVALGATGADGGDAVHGTGKTETTDEGGGP